MTKVERGMEIYRNLPPWFNIYPVMLWKPDGTPVVDYEALADWFDAKDEQSKEAGSIVGLLWILVTIWEQRAVSEENTMRAELPNGGMCMTDEELEKRFSDINFRIKMLVLALLAIVLALVALRYRL